MKNKISLNITLIIVILAALILTQGASAKKTTAYSVTDLGTLPGDSFSIARAINKTGQVAGDSTDEYGHTHAFLKSKGAMIDLGTLGGDNSSAKALNDRGQVVGRSGTVANLPDNLPPDTYDHAFLWQDGAMTDLGALGGTYSVAEAINIRGWVVGASTNAD